MTNTEPSKTGARNLASPLSHRTSTRMLWLLLCAIGGVLIGSLGAYLRGMNWPTSRLAVQGVGALYKLQLPRDITHVYDVHSIELKLPSGADDFARAFFNNYQALNNENPCQLIAQPVNPTLCRQELADGVLVQRNDEMLDKNLEGGLRPGFNQIVIELDNGKFDYCAAGVRLLVNGVQVEGVPTALPIPDGPKLLIARKRVVKLGDEYTQNSICAREIYQFYLEGSGVSG